MKSNPTAKALQEELDFLVYKYNRPSFIADDPICVPHQFSQFQDIEIAGFLVATLAWGQRRTIIRNGRDLMQRMDNAPHDFILNHQESDRSVFNDFVHRTFQPIDCLYFIDFLQRYYREHQSLETGFTRFIDKDSGHVGPALRGFHELFFQASYSPARTRKHVATPVRKSTCKRLNMFLRWMVRNDDRGVDFGIWKEIGTDQLLIPLDVHVERIARRLGLLQRRQRDWQAVLELTQVLKELDPLDPVKYDFALFGLGVLDKDS